MLSRHQMHSCRRDDYLLMCGIMHSMYCCERVYYIGSSLLMLTVLPC